MRIDTIYLGQFYHHIIPIFTIYSTFSIKIFLYNSDSSKYYKNITLFETTVLERVLLYNNIPFKIMILPWATQRWSHWVNEMNIQYKWIGGSQSTFYHREQLKHVQLNCTIKHRRHDKGKISRKKKSLTTCIIANQRKILPDIYLSWSKLDISKEHASCCSGSKS